VTAAKLATLVVLAAIWIFLGLVVAVFALPLWGMSIDAPLPWWTYAAVVAWIACFIALTLAIVRSKEIG